MFLKNQNCRFVFQLLEDNIIIFVTKSFDVYPVRNPKNAIHITILYLNSFEILRLYNL
jgi:hypothetical protein